jgi:hypothetical protein
MSSALDAYNIVAHTPSREQETTREPLSFRSASLQRHCGSTRDIRRNSVFSVNIHKSIMRSPGVSSYANRATFILRQALIIYQVSHPSEKAKLSGIPPTYRLVVHAADMHKISELASNALSRSCSLHPQGSASDNCPRKRVRAS